MNLPQARATGVQLLPVHPTHGYQRRCPDWVKFVALIIMEIYIYNCIIFTLMSIS
uniref:Uncharacterized protein n=1 Tax=Anguilla anguilla TaxID=7936 RepID=A0A0E9TCF4_ANGAN